MRTHPDQLKLSLRQEVFVYSVFLPFFFVGKQFKLLSWMERGVVVACIWIML